MASFRLGAADEVDDEDDEEDHDEQAGDRHFAGTVTVTVVTAGASLWPV